VFWEALVKSQIKFNRVPEKVPEKVWEPLVQSQVKFNRVPKKVPEKVPGDFGAETGQVQQGSGEGLGGFAAEVGQVQKGSEEVPGEGSGAEPAAQVQQGSGEGSREGLGGFGAEPGQVQQGFGEGSREGSGRLWCRASSDSTGFRREKVPEKVPASLGAKQGQVQRGSGEGLGGFGAEPCRFNRVSEKVPEKVPGGFGAGPGQVQRVQEEVPEKVAEKVPEKFVFLLFVCMHVHTGDLLCGCWGYHRSLFLEIVLEVLTP